MDTVINKSKWYLVNYAERPRQVLLLMGSFKTMKDGERNLFRAAAHQPDPRYLLQERVPGREQWCCIKGSYLLSHRRMFVVVTEHEHEPDKAA